ncbi:RsfA family transcriptional regulator [Metabacillus herbersteinensis]|uniref:RsfA family transcriptional regulator n=1 Tax=Metabacillus herbersteinensis TaxID=283816 RepID=A0ABV6GB24_9BACI
MKVRQDAWSHKDDTLLAETVLSYIRDGGTQIAAFDEVGDHLNRTSAACGFRWNAEVRKHYVQAIDQAKKERKQKKRIHDQTTKLKGVKQRASIQVENKTTSQKSLNSASPLNQADLLSAITLDECIAFLHSFSVDQTPEDQHLKLENQQLKEQNNKLLQQNKQLTLKYERLMETQHSIEDDYRMLMKIINQAQKVIKVDEFEGDKRLYN